MTYRGGGYLFGQYVVCAMCCIACPFGGSIAPSQTRQWTSYCASPFSILPTINCKPNLRGGKLVWRSQSDALGAWCVFCNFPYFFVPTWEVALVTFQRAPSGAHMWNRRSLVSIHWFRRIGRLLNPSRRYYNIFVRLSRHFWLSFRQFCHFWLVMMSSGDRVSQRCA